MMPDLLKHTKVYRGGATSPNLAFETKDASFHANASDRSLDLRFQLASKGGGSTSVLLQIGADDFQAILGAIARALPESVGTLSDCAALANKKILALLEAARKPPA